MKRIEAIIGLGIGMIFCLLSTAIIWAGYPLSKEGRTIIPASGAQQFKNSAESVVELKQCYVGQFLVETKEDGSTVITGSSGDTIFFAKEEGGATIEFLRGKSAFSKFDEIEFFIQDEKIGSFRPRDDGSAALKMYGRHIDIGSNGKISRINLVSHISSAEGVHILAFLKSDGITLKSEVAGSPTITFGAEENIEITSDNGKKFSFTYSESDGDSVYFDTNGITLKDKAGFSLTVKNDGDISISFSEEFSKEEFMVTSFTAMRKSFLIDLARQNEGVKKEIAQFLGLSGRELDIWNDFTILVSEIPPSPPDSDTSIGALVYNGIYSIPKFLHNKWYKTSVEKLYYILSALPPEIRESTHGTVFLWEASPNGGLSKENHIQINTVWTWGPDFTNSLSLIWSNVTYSFIHELGHQVDSYGLTEEQKAEFDKLHEKSGYNRANYASFYGMQNREEDFAEMFVAYTTDTQGLLTWAWISDVKLEKVAFMANLFAHQKEEKTYTYIFDIGTGGVKRAEVELGKDKLPVITEDITWEIF